MPSEDATFSAAALSELDKCLLRGAIVGYGLRCGVLTVLKPVDVGTRALRTPGELAQFLKKDCDYAHRAAGYEFFAGEARPGTGIVAVRSGAEIGPGGSLGLFLREKKDPTKIYFLAAGHVLTGFFKEIRAEIYRGVGGLTGVHQRRRLGVVTSTDVLKLSYPERDILRWNVTDAGVVRLDTGDYDPGTTCYTSLGAPVKVEIYAEVMKCGSEEPSFTGGVVLGTDWKIRVVHNKRVYLFKDQILVESEGFRPPFAQPGDSGTMVVVIQGSRKVVGMLMAGSVRGGVFFLNPIRALENDWKNMDLELVDVRAEDDQSGGGSQPLRGAPSLPVGGVLGPPGVRQPGVRAGFGRETERKS